MIRPRPVAPVALVLVPVLAVALLSGSSARAQTFPVVGGTQEIQVGIAAVSTPEIVSGFVSAQPELRWGFFLSDGLELQLIADTRVWPLGAYAPKSYGGSLNVLWFPDLGARDRNFYLLAGAGGAWNDPPPESLDASFDPAVRAGIGVKVPLDALGLGFLVGTHLGAEYRGEFVFLNEDADDYAYLGDVATDLEFLSGVAIGVSMIL
jgi:hypothetical protein